LKVWIPDPECSWNTFCNLMDEMWMDRCDWPLCIPFCTFCRDT